jgi:hypothetical protein
VLYFLRVKCGASAEEKAKVDSKQYEGKVTKIIIPSFAREIKISMFIAHWRNSYCRLKRSAKES